MIKIIYLFLLQVTVLFIIWKMMERNIVKKLPNAKKGIIFIYLGMNVEIDVMNIIN